VTEDVPLKEFIERIIKEMDERYEQRHNSAQKAIDEAKAESQAKFANTNEWRSMVSDAQANFVTKAELKPVEEQLRKCVTKADVIGMVSVIGTIILVLMTILNFAIFQHK